MDWQIKSLEAAMKIADWLDMIEKNAWIKVVRITMEWMFICPEINRHLLHWTPMREHVRDIILLIQAQE